MTSRRVSVIGGGNWGTALAKLIAQNIIDNESDADAGTVHLSTLLCVYYFNLTR